MTPRRITFALLLVLLACMVAAAQRVLIDRRSVAAGGLDYQTGLTIWHKPETLSGSNGDLIEQWDDSSGNNYHSYQPTSSIRPYLTNSILNSYSGIAFDGAGASGAEYLIASNVFSASFGDDAEYFAVVKCYADPQGASDDTGPILDASSSQNTHFTWLDSKIYEAFGSSARISVDPTPSLSSTFRLYNVSRSGTAMTNRLDTAQLGTATGLGAEAWDTTPTIGNNDGGSFQFRGWLVELIIYDHSLTPANRQIVETYLDDKYNLSGY